MSTKGESRKKKKELRLKKVAARVHEDTIAIRTLAQEIKSNTHLRDIIMAAEPKLRESVYKMIAPAIKKFAVYSFEDLMKEQKIVVVRHV